MPTDSYRPSREDAAILKELNDRYTYAFNQWQPIRDEAETDMRFVAGDPWDPKDRLAREAAGRPCLSLDELNQYFNQLINDVRANPRAPQFDPVGNGANDVTARFYADKMREIEYRSQAQIAYSTAFQNAVHRSYGWMRFRTKFAPKSFVQDLWIEDIPNPDLVLCDPDALRPTSSDAKYLFYLQSYTRDEFARDFPDAEIRDFTPAIQTQATNWISSDCQTVKVAEYWTVESKAKTLTQYRLPDGQVAAFYADELAKVPPGSVRINEREDEVPEVCMYLTNGLELLTKPGQTSKKVRWAGKYIPFISCFGMILYVDDGSGPKRQILSQTRLARGPAMLYCYYRTAEAEQVGMSTKFPYFAREGSLSAASLTDIQKSLHEPVAVIQVKTQAEGMQGPPEMPVRNPFEPAIQALEVGAEGARRAIQAAMGVSPLPTPMQQDDSRLSKVGMDALNSSAQKGSFHFLDHYDAMIQHAGVIAEDLMDKVYDTARETGIRDAKDQAKTIRINDPAATGPDDVPSVKGDHTVTVKAGPSFDSQRAQADAYLDAIVPNIGSIAQIISPPAAAALLGLSIKQKNLGPLGDEMYKVVTPPQYQQQDGQLPDPRQLMMQVKTLEQQKQQLQQAIQTKAPELAAKMQITQLQEGAESQRAALDRQERLTEAQLRAVSAESIAQAKVDAENFRSYVDASEQRLAKLLDLHMAKVTQALQQQHEGRTQAHTQAHEAGLAAMQHSHDLAHAQQAHDHALEQAQQSVALQTPQQPGE